MKTIIVLITLFIFSCEDDGIMPTYGCLNPSAENYEPNANVDDGSCIFQATFIDHVKPIFDSNCISCHGSVLPDGDLNLTNYDDMMSGGDSGPLLNINVSYDNTVLWSRIDGGGMPPLGQLSSNDLQIIKIWIEQGIPEGGD
tara:strand:+ start:127 stop:552 length:426 start_codon:yes stop_codon:yes gene_type:complete